MGYEPGEPPEPDLDDILKWWEDIIKDIRALDAETSKDEYREYYGTDEKVGFRTMDKEKRELTIRKWEIISDRLHCMWDESECIVEERISHFKYLDMLERPEGDFFLDWIDLTREERKEWEDKAKGITKMPFPPHLLKGSKTNG